VVALMCFDTSARTGRLSGGPFVLRYLRTNGKIVGGPYVLPLVAGSARTGKVAAMLMRFDQ
jgi:hypothetical protein